MPDLKLWTADECTSYGVKDGTVFWYPAARWGWTLSLPFVDVDVSRAIDGDHLWVEVSRPPCILNLYRWGVTLVTRRRILRLGWRAR